MKRTFLNKVLALRRGLILMFSCFKKATKTRVVLAKNDPVWKCLVKSKCISRPYKRRVCDRNKINEKYVTLRPRFFLKHLLNNL